MRQVRGSNGGRVGLGKGKKRPGTAALQEEEWWLVGWASVQLLSGSDNMLDLLEKQKIEILRVIFIDLKKDTKCDLL